MTKFTTNKYLAGAGRQDYAIFERRPRWESSEKALADLWQRTARLPAPLVAQDGQRFRVLYPGRRSARAGPDFRDAILRGDDGRRVVGDVELHLRAPDWYSHSHHADPNYNGVVLHVVLRPRGASDTRSQAGGSVPVVGLEAQAEALERASDAPPALPQVSEVKTPEELARLLAVAGDKRFLVRSGAFSLQLQSGDPDQVLYAALMESLGYSANRKPFRTLAARVPYAVLSRLRSEPGVHQAARAGGRAGRSVGATAQAGSEGTSRACGEGARTAAAGSRDVPRRLDPLPCAAAESPHQAYSGRRAHLRPLPGRRAGSRRSGERR